MLIGVERYPAGRGGERTMERGERAVPRAAPTPAAGPDLAGLVGRMAQGDEAALAALYDATAAVVSGLALRILRDRSAAEEVTIEAYTQGQHLGPGDYCAAPAGTAHHVTSTRSGCTFHRLRRRGGPARNPFGSLPS